MLKYISLLCCVFSVYLCNAQFYVGPLVGYGLSDIATETDNPEALTIQDDGFKGSGISIGLYAEYQLNNSLFLSYSLIHNNFKDESNVLSDAVEMPGNTQFKSLYNSVNIGYFYKPFFASIGPSINFNSNVENVFDDRSRKLSGSNSTSFAGNIKVGLSYKNFILAVDYIHDFNKRFDSNNFEAIQPIKTVFFSVAYMFELGGLQRGKMTTCPRF